MRPITQDEKQLVLMRLIKDLRRLRIDVGNLEMGILALGALLMPVLRDAHHADSPLCFLEP